MKHERLSVLALTLLFIAGAGRVLMQIAAMPPYAGLDEIYHVARVNFVANEGRNPTAAEPSVARYIHASLGLEEGAQPDFVKAAPRWREMVRAGYELPPPAPVPEEDRTTYLTPNYQAQQASPYYVAAAAVTRVFGDGSRLSELRVLRGFSAALALIAVLATAVIGYTVGGSRGIAAAGLLLLLPNWHTLMLRASNDALSVAALAVGLALTIHGSSRLLTVIAEAIFWALALATKLFTWPLLIVLPLVWWRQRADRRRIAIVAVVCLLALVATSLELRSRTGVAVGLGAFSEQTGERVEPKPIAYGEMLKITVASGIWMSGQHNNALTSKGMVIYVLPAVGVLALLIFLAPPKGEYRFWAVVALAALAAFAAAQAFHASAHIRNARLLGESMPAAGKEGWYWYALAPLITGVLIAPLFSRVRCAFLGVAAAWLLIWDAIITEGALFRDYAGLSGPETPSMLFRWGPSPAFSLELGPALSGLAVGPLTSWAVILRIVAAVALAALILVSCRGDRASSPDVQGGPARPSSSTAPTCPARPAAMR